MKSTFIAAFLAFSLIAVPVSAQAASGSSTGATRYYIANTKAFWKSAFGVRHAYANGFTTDLSDLQVRLARLAGLKPVTVKAFNILDDVAPTPTGDTPTPQPTPANQVNWGQKLMLGDAAGTDGGAGVAVAVLDTGVDITHPDLASRISGCADYTQIRDTVVVDQCDDANGHGTHVAGIVAATGGPDNVGVIGFAPLASISAFKVCGDSGICYGDDVATAMVDAVDQGANIIVLGMGGENESSFVDAAVQYAVDHEVLVVAAAGNDGPYADSMDWPARDARVVSVGAIDADFTVADFSSRGDNESTKAYQSQDGDLEMVAPGVNIESTFPGGTYAILSGTSMAAPAIAGLAARLWDPTAKYPAQTVRTALHQLTQDLDPIGDDNGSGWGIPLFK